MGEFGWLQRVGDYLRGENRRSRGRIRGAELSTPLGSIVNVSAGGMRLRTKRRKLAMQGCSIEIRVDTPVGESVRLRGDTVWSKQIGEKLFEIGIRWSNPEQDAALIHRLVEHACVNHNTTIFDNDEAA